MYNICKNQGKERMYVKICRNLFAMGKLFNYHIYIYFFSISWASMARSLPVENSLLWPGASQWRIVFYGQEPLSGE